ncbi:MAG TPA: enoyl-CoA hydratase/isomerase family protein [Candidatus Binatia bacterium]
MEEQKVLYEVKNQIAWIILNRPESMNAVNQEMQKEVIRSCQQANEDKDVQAVIIRGEGERAFSVGGDIKDRARGALEVTKLAPLESRLAKLTPGVHTPPQALAAIAKPTIALCHGYTIGTGLLMALACDIRVAADNAKLGLSEIRLGFMPASGGTQRMARLIGIPKALELCLSGESVDAQEAYRIGLVNRLVPFHQLIQAGEQMAQSFAKGAPLALRCIKEAIYKGSELSLDQGLRLESDLATFVLGTEDAKEGPRAFVEKRPPQWKGK